MPRASRRKAELNFAYRVHLVSIIICLHRHGWWRTYLLHIEDEKRRGLRCTRVATFQVYVRGRFVKTSPT
jgi:hypothetical protein